MIRRIGWVAPNAVRRLLLLMCVMGIISDTICLLVGRDCIFAYVLTEAGTDAQPVWPLMVAINAIYIRCSCLGSVLQCNCMVASRVPGRRFYKDRNERAGVTVGTSFASSFPDLFWLKGRGIEGGQNLGQAKPTPDKYREKPAD